MAMEKIKDVFRDARSYIIDRAEPMTKAENFSYGQLSLLNAMSEGLSQQGYSTEQFRINRDEDGTLGKVTLPTLNKEGLREQKLVEFRTNSVVPSADTFSKLLGVVRPKDEQFASNRIFRDDTTAHPGSDTVQTDIIRQEGEASVIARGDASVHIQEANMSIVQETNGVVTIAQKIRIPRHKLLQFDLRNSRNYNAPIDYSQEVMRIAMHNVHRQAEHIFWYGRPSTNAKAASDFLVKGFLNYFSGATADKSTYAFSETSKQATWKTASTDAIIEKALSAASEHITSLGVFTPKVLVLPHTTLANLGHKMYTAATSDSNTTVSVGVTALTTIRKTYGDTYGEDFAIVPTNALKADTAKNPLMTRDSFILIDNDYDNWRRIVVEPPRVLPAQIDAQQNIEQVVTMSIAGINGRRPTSAYMGTGI